MSLISAVMYLSPTTLQFNLHQKLHNGVTGGFQSDYIRVLGGGVVAFEQAPILGIGPANYRILAELLASMEHLRPDNHPHNFYLQLLAETGVIGMLTGTIFLWSIVWFLFFCAQAKSGQCSRRNGIHRSIWHVLANCDHGRLFLVNGTIYSCGVVSHWLWRRQIPLAATLEKADQP